MYQQESAIYIYIYIYISPFPLFFCTRLLNLLKLNIQKTKTMASGPITSWQIEGRQWKQCQTLFWGAPKSLQMVIAAMKLNDAYSLKGKL